MKYLSKTIILSSVLFSIMSCSDNFGDENGSNGNGGQLNGFSVKLEAIDNNGAIIEVKDLKVSDTLNLKMTITRKDKLPNDGYTYTYDSSENYSVKPINDSIFEIIGSNFTSLDGTKFIINVVDSLNIKEEASYSFIVYDDPEVKPLLNGASIKAILNSENKALGIEYKFELVGKPYLFDNDAFTIAYENVPVGSFPIFDTLNGTIKEGGIYTNTKLMGTENSDDLPLWNSNISAKLTATYAGGRSFETPLVTNTTRKK